MSNKSFLNIVRKRLLKVFSLSVGKSILESAFPILFSALIIAINLILMEEFFDFSSAVRTYIFFSFFILVFLALIIVISIRTVPNLIKSKNQRELQTAKLIGEKFPVLKDDLLNAMQLLNERRGKYSAELVEAAFERAYLIAEKLNFKSVVNFSGIRKNYLILLFLILLSAVLFLVNPSLGEAFYRLKNFNKEFIVPPEFSLNVTPGNTSVLKGADLSLTVEISGKKPSSLSCNIKYDYEHSFKTNEVKIDTSSELVFTERNIHTGFTYFFTAGDIKTAEYRVRVITPPYPENFTIKIIPPKYTGLKSSVQRNNGNFSSLRGSTVNVELTASKTLESAEILFDKSTPLGLINSGGKMKGSFVVHQSDEYFFRLMDTSGIGNIDPIHYSVKEIPDAFPEIRLISPEGEVQLTTQFAVPIILRIADDFGFSGLRLNYRLSQTIFGVAEEEFNVIDVPFKKGQTQAEIYYVWDVSGLYLAAGDYVSYFIEVADNDVVSGPKKARTKIMTLRVPSMDEVFDHADQSQNKAIDDLEEVLKEAHKLKEDFENISNELKKDTKEISFEEKEKIENAVKNFEKLRRKTEEIQKQLNEMKNNLQNNNLLSKETMKKYLELQELMDEINSDDLQKAFGKMQEMLQKLQRNQAQRNFENVKINEEAFQKSIERTLNLLKRIQVEQRVDELTKRTEKLIQDQQDISDQLNNGSEQDQSELLKKQQKITEELEKIRERMEELAEKMSELSDMPQEEMQNIMNEFEKQQNQRLSEQAKQKMMDSQMQEAMKNQQQLSQNLQKMQQMMSQMQQSMQQKNQMQVLRDMMKILDNIISLSKDQEKLKSQTRGMQSTPQFLNKNAEKQNELLKNTGKVIQEMTKLANKTFAITPEMGQALGQARSEMAKAISQMQNRNSAAAKQNQKNAMSSLNKAAQLTQGMMSQMMNASGQGGGMMSLMQQLQQLSQQQMSLNQMTQMMQQGRLSQQQMAQLQRLAGEQAAIQKSLEQLNREANESGQSKKLAADLKKAVEEMKEVVENIRSNNLDDNVIQKQERILSRLLDAQRSINDRDFEKERESKTAENFNLSSPPDEILSTDEGRDKLRDELLKAIREGYKKDYENLIRKYYEALQKKKKYK